MTNSPFVCRLEERCLIKISGADAESFLQDLVTNDVTSLNVKYPHPNLLPEGEGTLLPLPPLPLGEGRGEGTESIIYACLLTPQGRFLHDFFISRDGDGFFLECETARREDLIRRLKVFRLKSKVIIEDCESLFDVYAAAQTPEGVPFFSDPRLKAMGYRFYLPKNRKMETSPPEVYRDMRISLGIPEGGSDIKPDIDTLADVNLDRLNAISWDKGCYVGQEVTARISSRGLVKKRMVTVSGGRLTAGDILSQNGIAVGEVRSVNSLRDQGLAILKLAALNGSITQSGGEPVSARLPEGMHNPV